jgi:hypothetical protein
MSVLDGVKRLLTISQMVLAENPLLMNMEAMALSSYEENATTP